VAASCEWTASSSSGQGHFDGLHECLLEEAKYLAFAEWPRVFGGDQKLTPAGRPARPACHRHHHQGQELPHSQAGHRRRGFDRRRAKAKMALSSTSPVRQTERHREWWPVPGTDPNKDGNRAGARRAITLLVDSHPEVATMLEPLIR
jgi:hypothetical protein